MNPPLAAAHVSKAFAGVQALKDVGFELRSGEVHALVGENGAGKSTLIRIITGAVAADSGILTIEGRDIIHNSPRNSKGLGVAAIYQQPALFPDLSVAENIALALERGGPWRRVDWAGRRARARELLDRCGAPIDPDRPVASLSMSEQQIVEVAKAIGAEARIFIMDEPTAALTGVETERLFAIISGLRAQGAGVIYISHRLEEVLAIADRITVLRDGTVAGTLERKETDRDELIHLMVGRELSSVFPKRTAARGEIALELRGIANRAAGLHDISLHVRAGEVLGLAGLVGSGRTELAETIFGISPPDSGEILLSGQRVRIESPEQAIAQGIAYVPEDRRQHGVVLEMPLAANVSLASLRRVSRRGLLDHAGERSLAQEYIGRLRIKAEGADAETSTLSGGNQQKVALARWLATNPGVLILDEPTQGVDVGSKSEIHEIMMDLAARGMAILMISSELPEILGMCDRIAVMRAGSLRGELTREEATARKILALALGTEE